MEIPKLIHYCWFGNNPLDETALRCIESWKKFFPEYEIIQWNESNFDIAQYDFCKKAYERKKWAFVSDVARLKVVYEHGGLYFDTDVEVIRSYEEILSADSDGFMGFEATRQVATGLGFGAVKGCGVLRDILGLYETINFDECADDLAQIACPVLTTQLLSEYGLETVDRKQRVSGLDIYPTSYFSPIDYYTGNLKITKQTHAIHWYTGSWNTEESKKELVAAQKLRRRFGVKMGDHLYGILSCIKKEGFLRYVITRLKRMMCR